MTMPFIAYLLTGVFSSFLSGLLGIGGGLIIVPALSFIFTYFHVVESNSLMHIVIGSSMASAIANLAFSLRSHQRQQNIAWPTVKAFSPGVVIGALIIGPFIAAILPNTYLKILFGFACLCFGMQMFFSRKKSEAKENIPSQKKLAGYGLSAGILSTLVGIAGGAIIGTILNSFSMNMRKVVGTTTAIALILTISGTIGLLIVGYQHPIALPWCTGFIYWPAVLGVALPSPLFAPLGAKVAHTISTDILRKLFACLLLGVAVKMVI